MSKPKQHPVTPARHADGRAAVADTTVVTTSVVSTAGDDIPRPSLEGARDMLPLAIGFIPFALALGTAIAESTEVGNGAGWSGSVLIAAGSAHLALIELLDSQSGLFVACGTALVINARLAVYGAGLAPWFDGESARVRAVLALLIIDPLFVLATGRFERGGLGPTARRQYYLAAAGVLFAMWAAAMGAGVAVGASVPEGVGLASAAPLMMAGLLAGRLVDRSAVIAAATGGIVAVSGAGLPMHSATIVAICIGVLAAHRFGKARTKDDGQEQIR
jgi:predicted branched-subunit amino acid permease